MRKAGNKCDEDTQGQPDAHIGSETAPGKNGVRLTQAELEAWWPFKRLDPKRFPRAARNQDVEDALL